MNHRWVRFLGLLCACIGSTFAEAKSLEGSRPNIILVLTDDQGMGDLSCMGNPHLQTPHIDRLHSRSSRFTDFHVSPTCAPTRGALMSGRPPFEVGITHTVAQRERLAIDVITFPQALQQAGYTTGLFGKWHLGDEDAYLPQNRGFDEVLMHGGGGIGQFVWGDFKANTEHTYFDSVLLHNDNVVQSKGFCTDVFFKAALAWIGKQLSEDSTQDSASRIPDPAPRIPFFAYISLNAPHSPMIAPKKYKKRFLDLGFNEKAAARYGMIENIDDNMGLLMEKLEAWKALENTLVIFMTDNGMAMGSATLNGNPYTPHNAGMRGGKNSPEEGGTRVPSFWYWNGVLGEGVNIPALTAHLDIYRTFCELAGAEIPASPLPPKGRSLLPLLENPQADWPDRSLFVHKGRWDDGRWNKKDREANRYNGCAVRTARWRWVNNERLHDIHADPGQRKDVAAAHPEVVEDLKKRFDTWWESLPPFLVNEDLPETQAGEFALQRLCRKQRLEKGIPDWEPQLPEEAAQAVQPTEAKTSARPNIVVILTDDHRADYLGCAGHPILKTPNIDQLAAEGVRFENAFVTTAACTPNRTCLLTGQYERKHGVTFGSQSSLTEEAFQETYPMLLRQAGYYVGYVGKNHTPIGAESGINKKPESTPEQLAKATSKLGYHNGVMEAGFDYWYGNHGHSTFYPKWHHPIYRNARVDTQVEIFEEGTMNFLKPDSEFAGAEEFLRTKPDKKPFCLLVNFNLPHGAGTSSMQLRKSDPELYRSTYRDRIDDMPLPETYIAMADIQTPKIPKHVYNGKYIPTYNYVQTEADLRERLVRTCQTVTGVDRLVGNLIAELKEQGLYENTVMVFTSDHGLQLGEHGLGGKVLLYEESLRVPIIIFDPRLPAERRGAVSDALALTIDIAPTILELAGLPVHAEMQGKSLSPIMQKDGAPWREDFFCENMFMGQNYPRIEGVRSRDFKYIRYFDKKKDKRHILALTASIQGEPPIYEELYDLKKDPNETSNLVDSPVHAEMLASFRKRCQELVVEAKGSDDYPKTHVLQPQPGKKDALSDE
jgi:arylsulfatase